MNELVVRNRQRDRGVRVPLLREMTHALLEDQLGIRDYQLGILLVTAKTMVRTNNAFLHHEGATDVITFDQREEPRDALFGEIYICVAVAVDQAGQFGTTWEEELTRYVVHGVLHLLGHDDQQPGPRRKMKRAESCHLKALARKFPLEMLDKGVGRSDQARLAN
jgi:probable rRNA maturation factor